MHWNKKINTRIYEFSEKNRQKINSNCKFKCTIHWNYRRCFFFQRNESSCNSIVHATALYSDCALWFLRFSCAALCTEYWQQCIVYNVRMYNDSEAQALVKECLHFKTWIKDGRGFLSFRSLSEFNIRTYTHIDERNQRKRENRNRIWKSNYTDFIDNTWYE